MVNLDMTNISHQCPPGTTLRTDLPKRLCGIGISSEVVRLLYLMHTELNTDRFVGGLSDIRTGLQMHLVNHNCHYQLIGRMLMVSVSPMAAILTSTSGLLLQRLMKWALILR